MLPFHYCRQNISTTAVNTSTDNTTDFTTAATTVATTVMTTTAANASSNSTFSYLSYVAGVCENVTSGINIDILYTQAGLSNYQPIYRIVGAYIRSD